MANNFKRHGSRRRMYWKMVSSSLIRRASRLIIAVLAIAIGATILSGLVTIYYDIPEQLGREFRSYGANLIILPRGEAKITRETLNLNLGDTFTVQGVKYGHQAEASRQDLSAEENLKRDQARQNFAKKLTVKGIVSTGGAEEGFIFADVDMLDELIGDTFRADVIECSIIADAEELAEISLKIESEIKELQPRAVRRLTQSQDIVLGKLQALVLLVFTRR